MTESKKGKVAVPGGGIPGVVEMLKHMDSESREKLLRNLEARDPYLTQELRTKMVDFEDLIQVEAPEIQKLVRKVPMEKLALALRKCSEEVKKFILNNVSKRGAQTIEDEIKNSPSRKVGEVTRAQHDIMEILEEIRNTKKDQPR